MKTLTVDIIIPTWHPKETYIRLLESLKKQTYPVQKIIVMNTDKRYYKEEKYPILEQLEVFHVEKEAFDHGGTRNEGVKHSKSDILFFMTQDAVPADEHLVEEMMKPFENAQVAAVYGRQLPRADCNSIERYTRSFNYPSQSFIKSKKDLDRLGIKTFFCSNVCAAYRRTAYEELGRFPLHTIFNEDMIFTGGLINAGYAVAYAAKARVIHSHNYSGIQQFHRNFDLAVSQADNPQVFRGVRSEGEGIRLVKKTAGHLAKTGKIFLIPKLVYISGCKYLGYLMGRNYQRLPKKVVLCCSMNKEYWY